jgi:hypothetical protein
MPSLHHTPEIECGLPDASYCRHPDWWKNQKYSRSSEERSRAGYSQGKSSYNSRQNRKANYASAVLSSPKPKAATIPSGVEEAIESSKWILSLEDDWDENGTPKYSESTWKRACVFLIKQSELALELQKELPAPKILPGPEGSIDLHWKRAQFELLMNIPNDSSKPATFYGDDYGKSCIKGNLNPAASNPALIFWLLS